MQSVGPHAELYCSERYQTEVEWIQGHHKRMKSLRRDDRVRMTTSRRFENALRRWYAASNIQRAARAWLRRAFPNRPPPEREHPEFIQMRLRRYAKAAMEGALDDVKEKKGQRLYPKPWLTDHQRKNRTFS